jgi:hypothetical protein
VFAFCSLFSDNENPNRDTATASLIDTPAANEPPCQEADMVVKSPEAPVKKGNSRASKCDYSCSSFYYVSMLKLRKCKIDFLLISLGHFYIREIWVAICID